MNKDEFYELIHKDFNATDEQLNLFEKYKIFLQENNKIHNLTRLDSDELVYGEYFYNSIYPYKNLDWTKINKILDVGSGSGIPGIALKILFPHIELVIVESVSKKVNFMQQLANILDLENVIFINERAENINKKYRNYFDLVTARAVAELSIILELLIPYMKDDGICVIPKGKKVHEEMQNAKEIIRKLKVRLFNTEKYTLNNDHEEYVLFFKKNEPTPSIYPRDWKSIINNKK